MLDDSGRLRRLVRTRALISVGAVCSRDQAPNRGWKPLLRGRCLAVSAAGIEKEFSPLTIIRKIRIINAKNTSVSIFHCPSFRRIFRLARKAHSRKQESAEPGNGNEQQRFEDAEISSAPPFQRRCSADTRTETSRTSPEPCRA